MFPVFLVYGGLAATLAGLASLVKPLGLLGIRTRWSAVVVAIAGIVIAAIGESLPAGELRARTAQSELDQFVPVYQFHEFHSIRVAAPRERTYGALKAVTADEIALFHMLTWIRRFGQNTKHGILNPPANEPLLAVATRSGFLQLAEEPDREIVVGTLVVAPPGWRPPQNPAPDDFKALHESGFALAAMNFRLQDDGSGACIVTTETRIYATDATASRKFARYWRVIYPGSALIRRMWLRAIKKRAESES